MQTVENVTDRLLAIAGQSKGWLKFLGVLSIIYGILTAITIVGILIAWLPIWMGVLLFQAGSRADSAALTKDSSQLVTMMDKLRVYFMIQGVLVLIMLVALVIGFITTGGALFSIFQAFR
ncbi:MAG: DUF5362 domain-containing protein [candidate division KSB1 bacterium]|nr:DUF5362 domain-containing protein [candidate division KSB1 bacterium]